MFKYLIKDFLADPPLEMDISEPTDEIELWGRSYRMYKDEWKHHVHLKCTTICDSNCDFCIERETSGVMCDDFAFMESARTLLKQMFQQGQLRTVSITGGEPTIFPRLNELVEEISSYPLKLLSINTDGRNIDAIPQSMDGWVNISKHGLHDKDVFRREWELKPEHVIRFRKTHNHVKVRFQCVLGIKNGLQSVADIQEFMSSYNEVVDDFSFRSLIIEECDGDAPELFKEFRDWLFTNGWCSEQSIQDYYVYETFTPPGKKPITISWANMGLLQRYNETHGGNFLEEIIVHPDGMVTGSWNRKSLIIYDPSKGEDHQ